VEGKITSKQLFGKETARLMDELEQTQAGETQIVLIFQSRWDKILEKILRRVFRL